jgi:hypothetical protein
VPKIKYIEKKFRADSLAKIVMANEIIADYQSQGFKLTLRQLYYKFVTRNIFPNSEKSYDSLGALISDARLAGLIDWNAIEDRTRYLRENSHWSGPQVIVEACADQYRIDRWADQPFRVEVWIEKDALVGVLDKVCTDLDVPYFSCRGYTSQSEMWVASQRLLRNHKRGQRTKILHFGDHDPSGIDMTRDIIDRLELFTGGTVKVERLALNMDQIEAHNPPPNPAKLSDSRAQAYIDVYGDDSWELDALEPAEIVRLVEDGVAAVRDENKWEASGDREESEKDDLRAISENWDTALEAVR